MTEQEKNEIKRIRAEYEDHEVTKIDELKKLNRKVHTPGVVFGYSFGIIFTLILGASMSMVLGKLFSQYPWAYYVGMAAGIVAILAMAINPIIVKRINLKQRKKYQQKILALSQEILNEQNKPEETK